MCYKNVCVVETLLETIYVLLRDEVLCYVKKKKIPNKQAYTTIASFFAK